MLLSDVLRSAGLAVTLHEDLELGLLALLFFLIVDQVFFRLFG